MNSCLRVKFMVLYWIDLWILYKYLFFYIIRSINPKIFHQVSKFVNNFLFGDETSLYERIPLNKFYFARQNHFNEKFKISLCMKIK